MALVVAKVRVEVADDPGVSDTLVGLIVADVPVADGETIAESVTVPVKPVLATVHVAVAEPPGRKLAGPAAPQVTEKMPCPTTRVIIAVWLMVPLVPVTVIV